ncbi:ABC transporter ATP-binding protein [Streptomyces sp. NPDC055134]
MPEPILLATPAVTAADAGTGLSLSVTGLTKAYRGSTVVDSVDLEVAGGEFITFLGPSGSGKTTTLMMIAGFTEPDCGTVAVGGRDVTQFAPAKRDFGFVFQQYLLFPHMTVQDNVAFPLTLRGVPKNEIRRRVGETLEAAGLDRFAARKPRELSGGQQQRVALCRVLVYRPPVVLMDEPLGALDKKLRDQMQTEIKTIQRDLGLTVVYVTHDQEEALILSDRIAVMKDGRFEQLDTPRRLFERPATPFVADFLGAANFLPATVVESGDGRCAVQLAQGKGELLARQHAYTVGQSVRVSVRPGRLRLCPPGEGCLTATVDTVAYVGTVVRLAVRPDGTDAPLLRVETTAARPPKAGERIGLTADPDDVSVFAATDGDR